jgi:hypothetical protein
MSSKKLDDDHISRYQVYLFRERKLSPETIEGRTAVLRSLFVKRLRQPHLGATRDNRGPQKAYDDYLVFSVSCRTTRM